MGLVMFPVVFMAVTVVATVGEGHRDEAQRQGHREQQHYGQLSGQLLTSFLSDFSMQACAWYPSVGALIVGSALLFASPLRLAGIFLPTSMMPRAQPGAIGHSDYFTPGNSG